MSTATAEQTGTERIAEAFAGARRRAALMPYLMGGYPTLAESLRIGEACVRAGADLLELGMPYSDPLADGPVIHAAGTPALAAGANVAGVLEVARGLARERAGGADVLRQHGARARARTRSSRASRRRARAG